MGKRTERGGEVEGREMEAPKLLLNQGPSEPCYATVLTSTICHTVCPSQCPVALYVPVY